MKNRIKDVFRSGSNRPVYVISEIACAHEGQYSIARGLVEASARAGADAVQFQIFDPREYIHPADRDYALVKSLALRYEDWVRLFKCARQNGLEVLVAPYDRASVNLARSQGADGLKVHSADLNNPVLLKWIAQSGKPITLSIGGSLQSEIKSSMKCIRRYGNKNIVLMYGMQSFPTPPEDINLNVILKLSRLGYPIGYQDHSDGNSSWATWAPIISLGLGVKILEKHITYDRSKKGIDHEAALNPDEFGMFVKLVRKTEQMLGTAGAGSGSMDLNDRARAYRKYAKHRSIVTSRVVKKGEVMKESNLMAIRYRDGKIAPDQFPRVIGKRARAVLPSLHPVEWKDLY